MEHTFYSTDLGVNGQLISTMKQKNIGIEKVQVLVNTKT